MFMHVKALEYMTSTIYPVMPKFEGEEEVGSESLAAWFV
jgi:hypothetical protein